MCGKKLNKDAAESNHTVDLGGDLGVKYSFKQPYDFGISVATIENRNEVVR